MSEIKAIETAYNGCLFRSRLEARWAVFFDTLKIRWEYEPEGFELVNDRRYLPDFYLPEFDLWIEIKPGDIPGWWGVRAGQISLEQVEAYGKASDFANYGGKNLLMICGQPRYSAIDWEKCEQQIHYAGLMFFGNLESPLFKGTVSEICMKSLSEFLRHNGFDAPEFDGTLDGAWMLIEMDKEYYEKKHGDFHPHWAFGITDIHWRWVMAEGKPILRSLYDDMYMPGLPVIEALNAASYARFDNRKSKPETVGVNFDDIPF